MGSLLSWHDLSYFLTMVGLLKPLLILLFIFLWNVFPFSFSSEILVFNLVIKWSYILGGTTGNINTVIDRKKITAVIYERII